MSLFSQVLLLSLASLPCWGWHASHKVFSKTVKLNGGCLTAKCRTAFLGILPLVFAPVSVQCVGRNECRSGRGCMTFVKGGFIYQRRLTVSQPLSRVDWITYMSVSTWVALCVWVWVWGGNLLRLGWKRGGGLDSTDRRKNPDTGR